MVTTLGGQVGRGRKRLCVCLFPPAPATLLRSPSVYYVDGILVAPVGSLLNTLLPSPQSPPRTKHHLRTNPSLPRLPTFPPGVPKWPPPFPLPVLYALLMNQERDRQNQQSLLPLTSSCFSRASQLMATLTIVYSSWKGATLEEARQVDVAIPGHVNQPYLTASPVVAAASGKAGASREMVVSYIVALICHLPAALTILCIRDNA